MPEVRWAAQCFFSCVLQRIYQVLRGGRVFLGIGILHAGHFDGMRLEADIVRYLTC